MWVVLDIIKQVYSTSVNVRELKQENENEKENGKKKKV